MSTLYLCTIGDASKDITDVMARDVLHRALACGAKTMVTVNANHFTPGIADVRASLQSAGLKIYDREVFTLLPNLWNIDREGFAAHLDRVTSPDYAGLIMLDAEWGAIWPGLTNFWPGEPGYEATMAFDEAIATFVRERRPNAKVGAYGRPYVRANAHLGPRAEANRAKLLDQIVRSPFDFVTPEIYSSTSRDKVPEHEAKLGTILDSHTINGATTFGPDGMDPERVIPLVRDRADGWKLETPDDLRYQASPALGLGLDVGLWQSHHTNFRGALRPGEMPEMADEGAWIDAALGWSIFTLLLAMEEATP